MMDKNLVAAENMMLCSSFTFLMAKIFGKKSSMVCKFTNRRIDIALYDGNEYLLKAKNVSA